MGWVRKRGGLWWGSSFYSIVCDIMNLCGYITNWWDLWIFITKILIELVIVTFLAIKLVPKLWIENLFKKDIEKYKYNLMKEIKNFDLYWTDKHKAYHELITYLYDSWLAWELLREYWSSRQGDEWKNIINDYDVKHKTFKKLYKKNQLLFNDNIISLILKIDRLFDEIIGIYTAKNDIGFSSQYTFNDYIANCQRLGKEIENSLDILIKEMKKEIWEDKKL